MVLVVVVGPVSAGGPAQADPGGADPGTGDPVDVPERFDPVGRPPDELAVLDRPETSESIEGEADALLLTGSEVAASPGTSFAGMQPVTPARLLDTRIGLGFVAGPLGAGATVDVPVLGRGGVPGSGVGAVVVNITVTQPTVATFITAYPGGEPRPLASILNATAGQTLPNLAIVKVGAGGSITLYNNDGQAHLVVDIVGWTPTDAHLTPLLPARLLDTRADGAAPVGQAATIDVPVLGRGGVPATGVSAVVVNVTATGATLPTHVTAWPSGEPLPLASTLNLDAGETFPNLSIVKVGVGGAISLYNNAGSTHLVVDVMAWLPDRGNYSPLTPTRVLDTRTGVGAPAQPIGPHGSVIVSVADDLRVQLPYAATGVVVNVTAVGASAATFVTAYPTGQPLPTASNLNPTAGETVPNLVFVPLSAAGEFTLYNDAGSTHLLADLVGVVLARNVQDDLDTGSRAQVHVIYAIPADIVEPSGRADAIAHELTNIDAWLDAQSGQTISWDRAAGSPEISTVRIGLRLADLAPRSSADRFTSGLQIGFTGTSRIEEQLVADGFGHPDKLYIVFLEGVYTGGVCGVVLGTASSDIELEGQIGDPRYAHVFIGSTCDDPSTTSLPGVSETAIVATHESFHALGAVPVCAPNDNAGAHISTNGAPGTDLMGQFVVVNPSLDPGRDDYWGHARPSCPDLSRSPYLSG